METVRMCALICFITIIGGCASATTSSSTGSSVGISPRIYKEEYNIVFLKAVDAVSHMGWQITFTDKTTGIISAKTPTNFWTWGDTVSIRVYKLDEERTKVDVSSGTSRQIVDWGHNERNIFGFYEKLDNLIYSR